MTEKRRITTKTSTGEKNRYNGLRDEGRPINDTSKLVLQPVIS